MASRKHVTLVADADTTVTVTGRGSLLVINHAGAVQDYLYVNPISGAAASVAGDDMIGIGPGGYRVIESSDKDGSIALHVISASAITVSVEVVDPREFD